MIRQGTSALAPTAIAGNTDVVNGSVSKIDRADAARVLTHGRIEIEGRLAGASNATLYATATIDGVTLTCVYKPIAGERPLWDFPDRTLGHREVATCLVSDALAELAGEENPGPVPLTVWREDGPFGAGACQLWIDVDESTELVDVVAPDRVPSGWRSVLRALGDDGRPLVLIHADAPELRRMALLDIVSNNSDRKGGHILPGIDGRVYGIDHGLCFNVDDKLRTVLWGWAGEPLTDDERTLLAELAGALSGGDLGRSVAKHLAGDEIATTLERIHRLLDDDTLAHPTDGWPAIPWPAF